MKYKSLKSKSLILALMIAFSNVTNVQAATNLNKVNKDETVYTILNHDGSINNISVVNRLYNIEEETSIDFGTYLDVTPLRSSELLELGNNKIIWDTSNYIGDDFYYEGTLEKELPTIINIKYFLDGTEIDASELAGKTGEIKISFDVKQNPACEDEYKNMFMTQIQFVLDLDKSKIVSSDEAINTVAGKYSRLTYNVQATEDKSFELILDAESFEMESININLINYSVNMDSITEITDVLDDMEEGMSDLTDGTNKLDTGLTNLSNAMGEMNQGVISLSNGSTELDDKMTQYNSGLHNFQSAIDSVSEGVNSAALNLDTINEKSSIIQDSYQKIGLGLEELQASHNQLTAIANTLLQSPDPNTQALAKGILSEAEALNELTTGLSTANKGLSEYSAGISQVSAGLKKLDENMGPLNTSMDELIIGYGKLHDGYNSLNTNLIEIQKGTTNLNNEVSELPSKTDVLVDGQEKMSDGIVELNESIKDSLTDTNKTVVSFSDNDTEIKSLQFIMKTPEIKIENDINDDDTNNNIDENNNPWYKDIWNKLTDLFQ